MLPLQLIDLPIHNQSTIRTRTFVYNCVMFTSLLHLYRIFPLEIFHGYSKTSFDQTQFEDKGPRSNCSNCTTSVYLCNQFQIAQKLEATSLEKKHEIR